MSKNEKLYTKNEVLEIRNKQKTENYNEIHDFYNDIKHDIIVLCNDIINDSISTKCYFDISEFEKLFEKPNYVVLFGFIRRDFGDIFNTTIVNNCIVFELKSDFK